MLFFTSLNKNLFPFFLVHSLFNVLRRDSFSRLVSLFALSVKRAFNQLLLRKAIQNEKSQFF